MKKKKKQKTGFLKKKTKLKNLYRIDHLKKKKKNKLLISGMKEETLLPSLQK